jgi:hypothetical protein
MQHRSIIEAIQETDGFKYSERSAHNKEGGDGARLKYVCQDSLQNRDRKSNMKKEKSQESEDSEAKVKKQGPTTVAALYTSNSLSSEKPSMLCTNITPFTPKVKMATGTFPSYMSSSITFVKY